MILSSNIETSIKIKILSDHRSINFFSEGYTFLLVQAGSLTISKKPEKEAYEVSDTIILFPEESATLCPLPDFNIMYISFDRSLLDNIIPQGHILTCNPDKTNKEDRLKLFELLHSFPDCYEKPDHSLALIGKVYFLLDLLSNSFILPVIQDTEDGSLDQSLLTENIKRFVAANYRTPLTAKELASSLYISPRYLSQIFHDRLGTTFNKYLSSVRLSHAVKELEETDMSVTDIAMGCGFSGISAFFRLFNDAYLCTPTAYRKKIQKERAAEKIRSLPKEKETNGAISIPFSECSPSYASWSDTINAGDLKNALLTDFNKLFPSAQKVLHFRYVRFLNIFSSEFLPPASWESKDYPFTRMDYILDLLIQNHALPFFDLTIKMSEDELLQNPDIPPMSVRTEYLDALIRHCISRYNINIVSSFRFELWAEASADLINHMTPEEYTDSFITYKRIIKSLVPDAAFGGPGYNTASDPSFFGKYLKALSSEEARPDFVSIKIYPFEAVNMDANLSGKDTQVRLLSSDPDYAISTFRKYKKICRDILGDISIYITEISPGRIGTNHIGASAFSATWLCRNFFSLYKETDCIAYWNLFDHETALPMIPHSYSTGEGLFGKHGLKRPSFFALELMNRMKSHTLSIAPDIVCATNNTNLYQLILINYSHYNKNYCSNYFNRIPVINTYSALEEGSEKTCLLSISQLPAGHYRMTRDRLNQNHGSLLDLFISEVDRNNLSSDDANYLLNNPEREDVEYYSKHIAPIREISYIDIKESSGETLIEFTLEPNEVTFIQFDKKAQ